MGVRGKGHDHSFLLREGDSVPILQGAGWKSVPIWTGAEILSPIGVRTPKSTTRN